MLNIFVAFAAGLASFFAPCVVPLLPAYIGYITGVSIKDLKSLGYTEYIKKILLASVLYILGFSLIFVLLGTAAAGFGVSLRRYDFIIQKLGGFLILLLGLEFMGVVNFQILAKQIRFSPLSWTNKLGHARSFFLGLVFATTWTPCVGVVLGSILALAAASSTLYEGAFLLFIYSLGISLPFLIVSLTLASLPKYLSLLIKYSHFVSKIMGVLLIAMGLLLLTDTYKYVNAWAFDLFFRFGYQIK